MDMAECMRDNAVSLLHQSMLLCSPLQLLCRFQSLLQVYKSNLAGTLVVPPPTLTSALIRPSCSKCSISSLLGTAAVSLMVIAASMQSLSCNGQKGNLSTACWICRLSRKLSKLSCDRQLHVRSAATRFCRQLFASKSRAYFKHGMHCSRHGLLMQKNLCGNCWQQESCHAKLCLSYNKFSAAWGIHCLCQCFQVTLE